MRKWVLRGVGAAAAALVVLFLVGLGATLALARPLPTGAPGPEAEALAERVAAAIGADAWARTGAVKFRFAGHRYLWDRERNLVRYEDGRGVVLTEGWRPMGRAFVDGVEYGGAYKDRRVKKAYESFVNDAFWALAPTKLYDDGVTRSLVSTEAGPALLVSYGSGGVTPGDSYLWEIGPDGLPTAFRLWAGILPVKGARATWSGWITLPTGVRVATERKFGPARLVVDEWGAAEYLAELVPGEDPFAPMYR